MQEAVGTKREKGQKEPLKGKETLLRKSWRVSNKRGGGGKFGD